MQNFQKTKRVTHVKFNFKDFFVIGAIVDRHVLIAITRTRTHQNKNKKFLKNISCLVFKPLMGSL